MKILLANPRGFCAGVDRAIEIVEKALEIYGTPVYVRHEIVHNKYVVDTFCERGAVFVDDLNDVPEGSYLLFSAHGVSPEVRQIARERNHPHQDAIRCAGWISLFALHLPWPLLWVWSMLYRHGDSRIPVLTHQLDLPGQAENTDMSLPRAEPDHDPGTAFKSRLEFLEKRIKRIEYAIDAAVEEVQHEHKVSP